MKRSMTALALMIVAALAGTIVSLNPKTATAVGSAGGHYVALGDSVAAGAGLPPIPSVPEEQACGRSDQAYPYHLAAATGMSVTHLACNGAKADEGLYGPQQVGTTLAPPQLDRAFAAGKPDLITITIGANDARWSQFATKCYQWTCGSQWDDLAVRALLLDLRWELYRTFAAIDRMSNSQPPQVIITGYFSPFDPTGVVCNDTRNFTVPEMQWMNAQIALLNRVISSAAAGYAFVTYAPVDFTGHELCSAEPWIQGIQAPAPFHPTAAGQAAVARSIGLAF